MNSRQYKNNKNSLLTGSEN